jgi:hypothetical protein
MVQILLIMASWLSPGNDLSGCVSFWQRELGLHDWTIITRVVRDKELGGKIEGDIDINAASKTAIVRVMRLKDSDLDRRRAGAVQRYTIAHELMHLHLFATNNLSWRNEKVVDTALVALMQSKGRRHELRGIEGGIPDSEEANNEVAMTGWQSGLQE